MKLLGGRFVVTGGAGFIGSHVVDQLLTAGATRVTVLDDLSRGNLKNLEQAMADPRVQFIRGSICDPAAVDGALEGADGCFHLAGLRITQCAAEPRKGLEVMVDGTYNVIEACLRRKVGKVVFSSTASVYGMAEHFPTTERHHPWNNNTWYGAAKVCGEGMLRAFRDTDGLRYVALRYFNVYGSRMDAVGKYTEVFIRWMDCLQSGERPKIFGDGKQTMDFVCVEDVARVNLLAMASDREEGVYNVASGTETSLLQLLEGLIRACGAKGVVPECLPERKVNPVPRRLADVSAAKRDLGFEAGISLDEGLRRLVVWYRQLKAAGLSVHS